MKSLYLTLFILFNYIFVSAQGILFSEYRVILPNKDIKTLQVCNPTDGELVYTLNLIDQRMDEVGRLIEIPDSVNVPFSLKKNIKVYPKNIRLLPGECQEVQLQVKSTSDFSDGEYRTYLQFNPKTLGEVSREVDERKNGVAMGIIFRVSPAIPIMYRKNANLSSIAISDVKLSTADASNYQLDLTINKTGTKSVYGNIVIERANIKEDQPMYESKGLAIYGESDMRKFTLIIPKEKFDGSSGGSDLKISFVDAENMLTKKVLCDKQVSLQLPK